jgi:alpha-amylase/alpha-mannosidase (GH57 family)
MEISIPLPSPSGGGEHAVTEPRYICIHGHFYQPPRENPWLEAVEVQDSAAPYHDWNERITRECYAANSRARLLDADHKIAGLLNNYAWMSFNFGPTLLDWMEEGAPEVLHGIVEGDRLSRGRRRGHGNALAQVYNHVIMPLASPRDRRTEVRWGIADFRRRFDRDPEGMWLAETAVDLDTLDVLAAEGIHFTILAPRQAMRWRPIDAGDWTAIPEGIDPSRAYQCRLASGRSIVLFFYDGVISREVAFERLLDSGEKFVSRLKEGFDDSRTHAQLVNIATDGESYGHHHAHGDMALAYALQALNGDPGVRLTNYGEYLALHPPEWEVEVHENSSWSCFHGVERWRSACGCCLRPDWKQDWRAPLRKGLDALKDKLDAVFEDQGSRLFLDPWKARDDYIEVVLRRGDEVHLMRPARVDAKARVAAQSAVHDFLRAHGRPEAHVSAALSLLEMQRNALLMFTSCGWFFDEISGIETVQCLCYAARALQLAGRFGPIAELEESLLATLQQAPANIPEFADGRAVWDQFVRPARIDLERVLAHYAVMSLFRTPVSHDRVYCYEVESLDHETRSRPGISVAVGRLHARSVLTLDEAETAFVVIYTGGLDFHTVLRRDWDLSAYTDFKRKLFSVFETRTAADLATLVASEFPGLGYRVEDLFGDELHRLLKFVLQERLEDYQAAFSRLAAQDAAVLKRLGRMHSLIPAPMRIAASVVLDHELSQKIRRLQDADVLREMHEAVERATVWGYRPERERLQNELAIELQRVLLALRTSADPEVLTSRTSRILDAAALVGVKLDLWQTQNQLLDTYARLADAGSITPALHETLARLAGRLNISEGLLGWKP